LNVSTADGKFLAEIQAPGAVCFILSFSMDIIILVKLALKHELLEFNLLLKRII
jgi:hypothetical protein